MGLFFNSCCPVEWVKYGGKEENVLSKDALKQFIYGYLELAIW